MGTSKEEFMSSKITGQIWIIIQLLGNATRLAGWLSCLTNAGLPGIKYDDWKVKEVTRIVVPVVLYTNS